MKKKTIILVIISVMVLILIGIGFLWHRKNVNYCKDSCRFSPGVWIIRIEKSDKLFATQEQCVDYCLRHK